MPIPLLAAKVKAGMPIEVCEALGQEPDCTQTNVGTDFAAPLNELFTQLPAGVPTKLLLKRPRDAGVGYRMAATLRPKRPIHLIGTGIGDNESVWLFWDYWVNGIILDSAGTGGGAGFSADGAMIDGFVFIGGSIPLRQANNPHLTYPNSGHIILQYSRGFGFKNLGAPGTTDAASGLAIESLFPSTPGATFVDGTVTWTCQEQVHGIQAFCRFDFQNLQTRTWPGQGIKLRGHVGDPQPSNCNGFGMTRVKSNSNAGFGIWLDGSDVQAATLIQVAGDHNHQGGLHDHGDTGNAWIGSLWEYNGYASPDTPGNHADYQASLDLLSDSGIANFHGLYVEGGAPCKNLGKAAIFGYTDYGNGWSTARPPVFNEVVGPELTFRNREIASLAIGAETPPADVWDLTLLRGQTRGDIPTVFRMANISGSATSAGDTWDLRRGLSAATRRNYWGVVRNWEDTLVFGWPSRERNQSARLVVEQAQLGFDDALSTARIFSNPAYLTNGERMPRGSKYELTGSLFVPGQPDYRKAQGGTSSPDGGGMAYARWAPNTVYPLGSVVTDNNGNLQRRTAGAATASAAVEPVWSAVFGNTTTDNGVAGAWTAGLDIPDFVAGDYALNAMFKPNPRNGYTYRVHYAGNSGAGPPTDAAFGTEITLGTMKYHRYGYDFAGVRWYPGAATSATPV